MRITESRLRRIIRSVIAENESINLNESILSSAKESFKKAVKKIGEVGKNDIAKHAKDYPEYIEARTGIVKRLKAERVCNEYFQFAKNNDFKKNTNGKYNAIKWLKSIIKNKSSSENNYEFFIERLYLKLFEVLLDKELINTKVLGPSSGAESWRWNDEIQYSKDGKKKAKYKN